MTKTNLVTCARYCNYKTSSFCKLILKNHYFLRVISYVFFITKFQNCESEHNHELLWNKDAPMYGMNTNAKIERFIDLYIFYDVSLLLNSLQMFNNINTHIHVGKKITFVCRFHYPLPPMLETKIFKPLEIDDIYLF
jgi:hypothetical protein